MIKTVEKPFTVVQPKDYPLGDSPEFLLLGRSNVGKSSFINTLLNRKNFAYVSQNPGKTQTLNFYRINDNFYLVDAPGYGYAKTSKSNRAEFGNMIEAYLKIRVTLKHVFLLVDARHDPTADDRLMVDFLKFYGKSFSIIATKADKLSGNQKANVVAKLRKNLELNNQENIFMFSSITKLNKDEILAYIAHMLLT